jgi:drug/metabolite transporter (DMT)-like permease
MKIAMRWMRWIFLSCFYLVIVKSFERAPSKNGVGLFKKIRNNSQSLNPIKRLPLKSTNSKEIYEAPRVLKDYAILAIVPLVWGSYSPLIKGLYSTAEVVAPPPLIFNLMSYFVSFAALSSANYISSKFNDQKDTTTYTPIESDSNSQKGFPLEWTAGVELGLWLFLGSTVQISGIQSTTAIRAAILVQLTTIIVPFLETVFVSKKAITSKLWVSCIIAMIGVVVVSIDGGSVSNLCSNFSLSCLGTTFFSALGNIRFNNGDLLVSISAIFYSMHVIRLGNFASRVSPIKLAQIKSLTELSLSAIAILIVSIIGGNSMNSFTQFSDYIQIVKSSFMTSGQSYVFLAVLWNGAFATALTTWAQTVGQRSVSPTTANLLYSSQPIWASLISLTFLSESLSTSAIIGSALLSFAILFSLYEPPLPPSIENKLQ